MFQPELCLEVDCLMATPTELTRQLTEFSTCNRRAIQLETYQVKKYYENVGTF